jgi:hypothetical protein
MLLVTVALQTRPVDAQLLHSVNESGALQAESEGRTFRPANDPADLFQSLQDRRAFSVHQRTGGSERDVLLFRREWIRKY